MSLILRIVFSICFAIISVSGFAKGSAIFFCNNYSNYAAQKWAEDNQLSAITFMKYENVLLVEEEMNIIPNFNNEICFVTELRSIERHIAFSKNELIIRVKPGQKTGFLRFMESKELTDNIEPHNFIPNQYLLKNAAENEAKLNKLIAEVKLQNWVKVAQINTVHTLSATSVNDPLYDRQWALENNGTFLQGNGTPGADMDVDTAWTITTGSPDIKIVILDSGVDTLHEDLIDNMLPGYDGFASDTMDTKGFPTPNFSSDGHGTACAGIAAAKADNAKGVAGIAYNCKIIPIRIFYYQDYGGSIGIQATTNTEALINGNSYAWREAGGDIMSTSAGLPEVFIVALNVSKEVLNDEIEAAYYLAREGKGIAMFFSSGNDDAQVLWPANVETYTIAVGASSMCDERKSPNDCSSETWGSNYGTSLDFVAPGVRIASTDITGSKGFTINNYTTTFNGTSAACPNAAGVGALVLSVNPDLYSNNISSIIGLTADKDTAYTFSDTLQNGAWNDEMGYGRVNAFKAVKLAETFTPVSIDEKISSEAFSKLKIYPNPTTGLFYVENSGDETTDIQVFNIAGQQIKSYRISAGSREIVELGKGIYFVAPRGKTGLGKVSKVVIY